MTMNLIGTSKKPVGIQVKIYNPNELVEQGVFLHLNREFWLKSDNEKKKNKPKKYGNMALIDDYHLEYILRAGGWQIIKESLHFDFNPNKLSIVGIKIVKGLAMVDILENHVNIESIAKYYQTQI
jgi:hypothetical protein